MNIFNFVKLCLDGNSRALAVRFELWVMFTKDSAAHVHRLTDVSPLVSLSSDAPAPDVTNRHMSPLSSVDCDLKFCFSRPSYFPFVERLLSDDIIREPYRRFEVT